MNCCFRDKFVFWAKARITFDCRLSPSWRLRTTAKRLFPPSQTRAKLEFLSVNTFVTNFQNRNIHLYVFRMTNNVAKVRIICTIIRANISRIFTLISNFTNQHSDNNNSFKNNLSFRRERSTNYSFLSAIILASLYFFTSAIVSSTPRDCYNYKYRRVNLTNDFQSETLYERFDEAAIVTNGAPCATISK